MFYTRFRGNCGESLWSVLSASGHGGCSLSLYSIGAADSTDGAYIKYWSRSGQPLSIYLMRQGRWLISHHNLEYVYFANYRPFTARHTEMYKYHPIIECFISQNNWKCSYLRSAPDRQVAPLLAFLQTRCN